MKPGERIKYFRNNKCLSQKAFADALGVTQGFISDLERGRQEPSREFLRKLNDVYNISSDYILYSGTAAQWEKIEEKLKTVGVQEEIIRELHPDYIKSLMLVAREDWERGYSEGMRVCEPLVGYQVLPDSTKKIIDNVREILESDNEVMIDALKANIKAFLYAVRQNNKKNEDKGGD